jgi:hypothetical protein
MMRVAILLCGALCLQAHPLVAATRHVAEGNPSASAPFLSWATAAASIQDALDVSVPGDEILVSNGIYQVGSRVLGAVAGASRVAISNAVAVRSVNGWAFTAIKGDTNPVVRSVYMADGAVLEGFTIFNGAAVDGGGIYAASRSATVRLCRIEKNIATGAGAGIWSGTVEDSLILTNDANVVGSTGGGGAHGSALLRCTVVGNRTRQHGGGLANGQAVECHFEGNFVQMGGGGAAANSQIVSCVITGNAASTLGMSGPAGGLYFCTTTSSLISGNLAITGGGAIGGSMRSSLVIGNTAGFVGGTYAVHLENCVVVSNRATPGEISDIMEGSVLNCIVLAGGSNSIANAQVRYSICVPFVPGEGNLAVDPLLASATDPLPLPGSPVREAGLNQSWMASALDWDGAPRLQGARVDIGVYESGPLDTDGDGLADEWELMHFTNLTVAGAATDSDADGMSDRDEYRAGLQPTNAMSRLELYLAAEGEDIGVSGRPVRWPSAEGRSYRVDRSTNLITGFEVLQRDVAGAPPLNTYYDAGAPGAGSWIYRVVLDP